MSQNCCGLRHQTGEVCENCPDEKPAPRICCNLIRSDERLACNGCPRKADAPQVTPDFRWLVEENSMPTAAEIRQHAGDRHCSMMQAKAELLDRSAPRLQYFDREQCVYVDVPVVVEIRK